MSPTDQGFEAADLAAVGLHDRLVVQFELAGGKAVAQVLLQRATALRLFAHGRLEEAVHAAAVAFRAIQGQIGIVQELLGRRAVTGRNGDPDARAHNSLVSVEPERSTQGADNITRQRVRFARIGNRRLEDDEFIATHARDRIAVARELLEAAADILQQDVAGLVAQGVVDGLELVEIDVVDREHPALFERLLEALTEQGAIGEVRQRVVVRHMRDLQFRLALLGDVFVGRDPSEVGHRSVPDLEGSPVPHLDDAVHGLGRRGDIGPPSGVFLPRHCRHAAGFEAHVEDLLQRRARTNAVGRQAVHFDVVRVADQQPMVGAEEAKSLRHVVDRDVELKIAFLEPRTELFALGNVLVCRHAAAVGQGMDGVGDDSSVGELLDRLLADDRTLGAGADIGAGFSADVQAQFKPMLDQVLDRRSRVHLLGRERVHLTVARIAENDPAVAAKQDDPEPKIVGGALEQLAEHERINACDLLITLRHARCPRDDAIRAGDGE